MGIKLSVNIKDLKKVHSGDTDVNITKECFAKEIEFHAENAMLCLAYRIINTKEEQNEYN
jgi:hypothetical protein